MFARISTVILVGFLLAALGGVFQAATAQTEANKAIVERWAELWNTGDLAIADEVLATDFVPHVPYYPQITDLESYKAEVISTRTMMPDWHFEVHDMVTEGDKVAYRITGTGTLPVAPQYTNAQICMGHFAGGKIVEEWWNYNMLGCQQQLGQIDPMGRVDFTWGTPSEVTGDPGTPEANKQLVLRQMELWNTGNLAIADEIFATDFVNHDVVRPDITGPESLKGQVIEIRAAFPDFRLTAEDIVAEGDKVACRYTVTGTPQGEFESASISRIAGGKIVECWWVYDGLALIPTAVESRTWGEVKALFRE